MNLKINDKEYGLSWGMGCFEIYCEKMDCSLNDGFDLAFNPHREQNKYFCNLVYAALQNKAELDGVELEVNYRQLQNAIDEAEDGLIREIEGDFLKSKYQGKAIADYLDLYFDESEGKFKKKST